MSRSIVLTAVAVLFVSLGQANAGFYSSSDSVVTLTPDNFDQLVGKNDTVWIVELYAQWCGHCKSLTPGDCRSWSNSVGSLT